MSFRTVAACAVLCLSTSAVAGFDWGADCDAGSGEFSQFIDQGQVTSVGVIPTGKQDIEVRLESDVDVDIQLIDVATGTELIAWPNGILSGASEECGSYQGLSFCYSGYNGGQTAGTYGHEYIRINGEATREVEMRAYGYAAGDALVTYRFNPVNTCNETGNGAFSQAIAYQDTVLVGDIPAGKSNVAIELDAGSKDVDVQLWDGETAIVAWPDGLLSGAGQESVSYRGMTITYSGYNGIGGNWGRESIEIAGQIPADLTMKAFGYQSGNAEVTYAWGVGVGDTCGGIGALTCDEGLACKEWLGGVADAAGTCHTQDWCGSDETAATDCDGLPHIMTVGAWGCSDTFTCEWVTETGGAGVNESCDTTADCASGLVCLGEYALESGMWCIDDSQYGTFSYAGPAAIGEGNPLVTTVDVQGLASVPLDVVLTLDVDHPRKSDLVVTISNFNGYSEVVWDREANPANEIVVRAFPSDDEVNGEYFVTIEDVVTGETGTLRGWDLYIASNWD
ncbi:MAG: hypothetical protein EP330_01870 [Deltaproteobacteria bacterium]|nr:MAG: hypothetical protein EP330_01870 [Deltaproteobacteria bacterium]